MLDPKNWDRYIHDGLEDDVVKNILFTDTTQEIVAHTVTKDVTNSRVPSNRDDVLQKVEYDELNTLFWFNPGLMFVIQAINQILIFKNR